MSNTVCKSSGIRTESKMCGFASDEIILSSLGWGKSQVIEGLPGS